MAQWMDRYEKHPIHAQIQSAEQLISASEVFIGELKDPNAIENLERLRLIINALRLRFKNTDPLLISIQALNSLNQQIQPVINEISNFSKNRNPGHLTNANSHADALLSSITNILAPVLPEDIDSIKDSVSTFRRSVGQSIRSVEAESNRVRENFNALGQQFKTLTSDISTQKGRLDTAITQFQQQFSDAENKRRDQFEQAKDKRKEDYEKLILQISDKFNHDIQGLSAEFRSLIDKTSEESGKLNSDLDLKASALIQEIEKRRDKAAELVTIITNSGMIGGYQTVANQERTTSRFWQTVTSLSLLGLIAFAVFAYLATVGDDFRWAKVGARAFVAVTFGILAAYAARQADKHEMIERRSRKMELELAAIDPYLSELSIETRHKIKEELASRLFAQNDQFQAVSDSKTSGSIVDLLRMALETISNLTKKSGG